MGNHIFLTGLDDENLIAQLGGERETISETWPGGLTLVSRFGRGQFEVLGFEGDAGDDHMKHLRNLSVFLKRLQ